MDSDIGFPVSGANPFKISHCYLDLPCDEPTKVSGRLYPPGTSMGKPQNLGFGAVSTDAICDSRAQILDFGSGAVFFGKCVPNQFFVPK